MTQRQCVEVCATIKQHLNHHGNWESPVTKVVLAMNIMAEPSEHAGKGITDDR